MATKVGELREMLIAAIDEVRSGKMDDKTANSIAKLAAQVNHSLQVEINAVKELRALGLSPDAVGGMQLGEIVDPAPTALAASPEPIVPPAKPTRDTDDPDADLRRAAKAANGAAQPRMVQGRAYK